MFLAKVRMLWMFLMCNACPVYPARLVKLLKLFDTFPGENYPVGLAYS